jgi:hypothetical protein
MGDIGMMFTQVSVAGDIIAAKNNLNVQLDNASPPSINIANVDFTQTDFSVKTANEGPGSPSVVLSDRRPVVTPTGVTSRSLPQITVASPAAAPSSAGARVGNDSSSSSEYDGGNEGTNTGSVKGAQFNDGGDD